MPERYVRVEVSNKTKRKVQKLLKELHEKDPNIKTENDVITYLCENARTVHARVKAASEKSEPL